jgi:hypothetical protein
MTQQMPIDQPNDPLHGHHGEDWDRAMPLDTRTPLFQASHAARYHRQDIIKQIQGQTGRALICYVSDVRCGIDQDDTVPFGDLLHNVPRGESMELLLHTPGGSVDAAEKLIRMVRGKVEEGEINIIVPDFAKSAGTLMVLGADRVVMSDMSELGPIDPQMRLSDNQGQRRWQSVQNYLDAYDEYNEALKENPNSVPARMMLDRLDPLTVKLCQAAKDRARQSAEHLLREGMFRKDINANWSMTAAGLLDTRRWLSHSQMISWQDARHPDVGLMVEYIEPESDRWQSYWRLYCLQRLAVESNQKLYESAYVSLIIDGPTG